MAPPKGNGPIDPELEPMDIEQNPADALKDAVQSLPAELLKYGAIAVAVLVVLWLVWRVFSRRTERLPARPYMRIEVDSLGEHGPPPSMPSLELYHIPVRLAAIVLAPAGRAGKLPTAPEEIDHVVDCVVPGLSRVAASHRPRLIRWPPQISTRGFSQALFTNLDLPGDGGKGSPWSAVAGGCKVDGTPIMVGLIVRAKEPNEHGRIAIETPSQWLGAIAVKGAF